MALARLFQDQAPPWVLKGAYALELLFKAARSTVDIDLTVQRIAVSAGEDQNQIVRDMLQNATDAALGDWFEFTFDSRIVTNSRPQQERLRQRTARYRLVLSF